MNKKFISLLLLLSLTIPTLDARNTGRPGGSNQQPIAPVNPPVSPSPDNNSSSADNTNTSTAGISKEQKEVLAVVAASAGIVLTAAIAAYRKNTMFKTQVNTIAKTVQEKYGVAEKWTRDTKIQANNFIAKKVKDIPVLKTIFTEIEKKPIEIKQENFKDYKNFILSHYNKIKGSYETEAQNVEMDEDGNVVFKNANGDDLFSLKLTYNPENNIYHVVAKK